MMTEIVTVPPTAISVRFEYEALSQGDADLARAAAARVRSRVARQMSMIIETGQDLLQVKQVLEHGQFTAWVEAECGFSVRTAQSYMNAAGLPADKHETVSLLPPKAVYAIAALPEDRRSTVLEQLRAGAIRREEVDRVVRTAKEEVAEEKRLARMTPEQRKKEAQRVARKRAERAKGWAKFDRETEEFHRLREQKRAMAKVIAADLQDRLGPEFRRIIETIVEHDISAEVISAARDLARSETLESRFRSLTDSGASPEVLS